MKRMITYGLSVALVFSLTACTSPKDEPQEDTNTPAVTEPADTSTPEQDGGGLTSQTSEGQGEYIVDINSIPDDLLEAFEYAYNSYKDDDTLNDEDKISLELMLAGDWCSVHAVAVPDNMDTLYPEWRAKHIESLSGTEQTIEQPQETPSSKPSTPSTPSNSSKPSGNTSSSGTSNSGATSGGGSGSSSGSTSSGEQPPFNSELPPLGDNLDTRTDEEIQQGIEDSYDTIAPIGSIGG